VKRLQYIFINKGGGAESTPPYQQFLMEKEMKKKTRGVCMDDETNARLNRLCKTRNISRSAMVRILINEQWFAIRSVVDEVPYPYETGLFANNLQSESEPNYRG